jgi:hypothetical protein
MALSEKNVWNSGQWKTLQPPCQFRSIILRSRHGRRWAGDKVGLEAMRSQTAGTQPSEH